MRKEAARPTASRLFVRGIGLALAIHLARNYTAVTEAARGETSSLPGFKLRRVTDWMAEQAGMSEFHFNRLFKRATGVPPSQYQIKLRIDAARRLLRETKRSVITIANEVGYSNPSHFAQLFRKATGLAPTDYRRERQSTVSKRKVIEMPVPPLASDPPSARTSFHQTTKPPRAASCGCSVESTSRSN